jgi:hypothetical protein
MIILANLVDPVRIIVKVTKCTLYCTCTQPKLPVIQISVAGKDPRSVAVLTPGFGIRDPEKTYSGSRIPNPYF